MSGNITEERVQGHSDGKVKIRMMFVGNLLEVIKFPETHLIKFVRPLELKALITILLKGYQFIITCSLACRKHYFCRIPYKFGSG